MCVRPHFDLVLKLVEESSTPPCVQSHPGGESVANHIPLCPTETNPVYLHHSNVFVLDNSKVGSNKGIEKFLHIAPLDGVFVRDSCLECAHTNGSCGIGTIVRGKRHCGKVKAALTDASGKKPQTSTRGMKQRLPVNCRHLGKFMKYGYRPTSESPVTALKRDLLLFPDVGVAEIPAAFCGLVFEVPGTVSNGGVSS